MIFNKCWLISSSYSHSCGLNICSKESKAESAIFPELKKPRVVAELDPGGVNIEFVPPWCHPVRPQVDALGFSLQFRVSFMPSAPGSGTWHSSRAQSRHGSYTLAPKRLEAFTLSEQTSGQMATQQTDMALIATMSTSSSTRSWIRCLFSSLLAVICKGATVRRLPIPTTQTKCQQDIFEHCSRHSCTLLNYSADCIDVCHHLTLSAPTQKGAEFLSSASKYWWQNQIFLNISKDCSLLNTNNKRIQHQVSV